MLFEVQLEAAKMANARPSEAIEVFRIVFMIVFFGLVL